MAKTSVNVEKLRNAIEHSKRTLRPFRETRVELIRDYCGSDYHDRNARRPQYLPLMHQAADTYTQTLVADRPRLLVSTRHRDLKWFAKHFERSINQHIKEIRLEQELRMAVLEAFFCAGIVKVYYGEDQEILLEGTDMYVDPGKPYAECISLDNFGFDVLANSWRKISFAYDEYDVDRERLLDDPQFKHARDAIVEAAQNTTKEKGYLEGAANLVTTHQDNDAEFIPKVRVMDVWIPKRGTIVTMLAEDSEGGQTGPDVVLREVEHTGPESGPYHLLTFSDVPDNIIGVSPGMTLNRLASLLNSLYRKQASQARRQRDIPIYEGDATQDAKNIANAEDGRWTRVTSKDGVDVLKMGGVDAGNQQFGISSLELFDRMAGNLQAMAGLGAQAETLGQDQIIQSQVSRLQSKMQERVANFTTGILRDLGWLLWHDQAREVSTEYEIPGTGIMAGSVWTPEHREGDFLQYNFDLDPYSMQYKSPSMRANGLLTYVNNIAAPMMQAIAQQGGQIDFKQLTEYYSELMDLPRLKDVVVFQPDQRDAMQPQAEPAPGQKSPRTTRTHIRQNVSTGGTPQSRSLQQQQALASVAQAQQSGA